MRGKNPWRRIIESLSALALLAAVAGPFDPAEAQTNPAPQRPRWIVDHGELFCSLVRTNGPAGTFFAVRIIPGMGGHELLVSDTAWRRLPITYGQRAALLLSPGGVPIEARTLTGRLPNGDRLLGFDHLDDAFLDSLAQSTRLEVARGARTAFTVDFPRAGRAVEALRTCADQTLGE